MPTKEQMKSVVEHINDVISRRYIEGDGDMCSCVFQPEGGGPVGVTLFQGIPVGTPEPFADLPSWGKIELLGTYIGWKGFSESERSLVIDRVLMAEALGYGWTVSTRRTARTMAKSCSRQFWQAEH